MIERGKQPGNMEGRIIRCRIRRAQAEMGRGHGHRSHQRHQIHFHDADAMPHCLLVGALVLTGHGQAIVKKRQMKLAGFQHAGDVLVILRRHEAGSGMRMAP